MNHEGSTFLSAVALDINTLFCTKEGDQLAADDRPNSTVFVYRHLEPKQWQRIKPSVAWTAVGMALITESSKRHLIFGVSPRGKLLLSEMIATEVSFDEVSNVGASIRTARTIGGTAWIVGMGRKAFKRSANELWTEDGPSPKVDDGKNIIGFEDIDGFDSEDIYAVGWRGEVWHQTKGQWRQIESPTSRNLNAVCCAEDGNVYAVGQKGTLLIGRGDSWRIVDSKLTTNLLDVTEFEGVIFICTDHTIFKLQNGKLVPEDRFEDERRPATCLHLLKTIGGVYAVGPKDIFRFEGNLWRQVV
jgi:hypothetical protein